MKELKQVVEIPEESWLKKAAAAPEAPQQAERCNPLPQTIQLPMEGAEDSSAASSPSLSGDRYAPGREFARGGLGRILRVDDLRLSRTVALKELITESAKARERFLREALLTARLEHPGIVPVHDLGVRASGELFYTMKLVDGRSLDKVIEESATLPERLSLLSQVRDACKAVAYAHSKGIIHRDLKPHNMMLGAFGETLVIDWGLAKDLNEETREESQDGSSPFRERSSDPGLTSVGSILGTPAYMPPEQAQGSAVDKRADVYSLGAILYHLLSGAPPYRATRTSDVVRQVSERPPTPLQELVPQAPRELIAITQKAMARAPQERYPDAASLAEDIDKFLAGLLVEAHPYSRWQLFSRWIKAHRLAVTLSLVLIGAAAFHQISVSREQRETQRALTLAQENERDANQAKSLLSEQVDHLLLANARTALRSDPSEALAWLKHLPPSSPQWSAARLIMEDALRQGTSRVLLSSDSSRRIILSPDGSLAAILTHGELSVWSLHGDNPERRHMLQDKLQDWCAIAFSPDGKLLAVDTGSSSVALWDVTSGAKRAEFSHAGLPDTLRFSPDGSFLAAARVIGPSISPTNDLYLWEIATGRSLVQPFSSGLSSLAFSRDDASLWLAGALPDGKPFLSRWDLIQDNVQPLPEDARVLSLESTSTEMLASVSASDGMRLQRWSLVGALLSTSAPLCSSSGAASLSPDMSRLAISCPSERSVSLLDSAQLTPKARWEVPQQSAQPLFAFIRGEDSLLFASGDELLLLRSNATPQSLRGHAARVVGVCSLSSRELLSAADDGGLRRWMTSASAMRVSSREPLEEQTRLAMKELVAGGPSIPIGVYLSQDSSALILLDRAAGMMAWSVTGDPAQPEPVSQTPLLSSALSEGGARLAVGHTDGSISVWDVSSSPKLLRVLSGHKAEVSAITFINNDELISGDMSGAILHWEGERSTQSFQIKKPAQALLVLNGELLVSGRDMISRWRLDTAEALEPIATQSHVELLASPNGSVLAVYFSDKVSLFDVASSTWRALDVPVDAEIDGTFLQSLKNPRAMLFFHAPVMTFSPDGAWLAISGRSRTLSLIEVATGRQTVLQTGNRRLTGILFSADGKRLLGSAGERGFLWDVQSGERRELPLGARSAFSSDGLLLATTVKGGASIEAFPRPPQDPKEMLSWLEGVTALTVPAP